MRSAGRCVRYANGRVDLSGSSDVLSSVTIVMLSILIKALHVTRVLRRGTATHLYIVRICSLVTEILTRRRRSSV